VRSARSTSRTVMTGARATVSVMIALSPLTVGDGAGDGTTLSRR
jgi:hypothetical protein